MIPPADDGADTAALNALQMLCGMRRYVAIETNSLGTVISALDMDGNGQVKGRGPHLRAALADLARSLRSPSTETPDND